MMAETISASLRIDRASVHHHERQHEGDGSEGAKALQMPSVQERARITLLMIRWQKRYCYYISIS
jgi:hypothetical protein